MTKNEYLLANQPKVVPAHHHWNYMDGVRKNQTLKNRVSKQATDIATGMVTLIMLFVGLFSVLSIIIVFR